MRAEIIREAQFTTGCWGSAKPLIIRIDGLEFSATPEIPAEAYSINNVAHKLMRHLNRKHKSKIMIYHCLLNTGIRVDINSISAAQAMQICLGNNPGFTITECWSGDGLRNPDYGFTEYEVPKHVAATKTIRRPKSSPPPCELFDDAQVLAESARVLEKERFERGQFPQSAES